MSADEDPTAYDRYKDYVMERERDAPEPRDDYPDEDLLWDDPTGRYLPDESAPEGPGSRWVLDLPGYLKADPTESRTPEQIENANDLPGRWLSDVYDPELDA